MIDLDFGADGALYVAPRPARASARATGVWRFSYTGGDDTPGPDPQYAVREGTTVVDFDAGRSGGVGLRVDVLRRRHRDRRERDAHVRRTTAPSRPR